jgi:hypothetical protein
LDMLKRVPLLCLGVLVFAYSYPFVFIALVLSSLALLTYTTWRIIRLLVGVISALLVQVVFTRPRP